MSIEFITIREAAKQLNSSVDNVLFLMESQKLTGYFSCLSSYHKARLLSRFKDTSEITEEAPKLLEYAAIQLPFYVEGENIFVEKATIFNKDFSICGQQSWRKDQYYFPIIKIKILSTEINTVQQQQRHAKLDEDLLDWLIRRAVTALEKKGTKKWTYHHVFRQIARLRQEDPKIGDMIDNIDLKEGILYWSEGSWKRDTASIKTIQNRLSDLYPKGERKKK